MKLAMADWHALATAGALTRAKPARSKEARVLVCMGKAQVSCGCEILRGAWL